MIAIRIMLRAITDECSIASGPLQPSALPVIGAVLGSVLAADVLRDGICHSDAVLVRVAEGGWRLLLSQPHHGRVPHAHQVVAGLGIGGEAVLLEQHDGLCEHLVVQQRLELHGLEGVQGVSEEEAAPVHFRREEGHLLEPQVLLQEERQLRHQVQQHPLPRGQLGVARWYQVVPGQVHGGGPGLLEVLPGRLGGLLQHGQAAGRDGVGLELLRQGQQGQRLLQAAPLRPADAQVQCVQPRHAVLGGTGLEQGHPAVRGLVGQRQAGQRVLGEGAVRHQLHPGPRLLELQALRVRGQREPQARGQRGSQQQLFQGPPDLPAHQHRGGPGGVGLEEAVQVLHGLAGHALLALDPLVHQGHRGPVVLSHEGGGVPLEALEPLRPLPDGAGGHGEGLHLGGGRTHLQLRVVALPLAAARQEVLHEPAGPRVAPGEELGAIERVAVHQHLSAFSGPAVGDVGRVHLCGDAQEHVPQLVVAQERVVRQGAAPVPGEGGVLEGLREERPWGPPNGVAAGLGDVRGRCEDARARQRIHGHAGPPVAAQGQVRGVRDAGVHGQRPVPQQHVHLPHRAVVPVELIHPQHGAAGSFHGPHEHPGLGEGRVTDDAWGPVPLRAAGRPGLEGRDVGGLVGPVVEQHVPAELLVEDGPHLACELRRHVDFEVLVLQHPGIDVRHGAVAGPQVLGQVR
mmetsp:Transcript_1217/g.1611  ORF Transcript_1217/g.1611 Transcript_1217/m.1611 type:complete len:684 (-) Transcript_1217:72-2123(-)